MCLNIFYNLIELKNAYKFEKYCHAEEILKILRKKVYAWTDD